MKNALKHTFLALILAAILSCSAQKDRFLNREYHSINTKFNVLFNGQEALDIGTAILESQAQDNFLSTLPVELITLDGEDENVSASIPSFIRAEDKAVKAIQKHSMNFKGVQKNSQIDKAYLLLGKSRYYDRRFLPALEAFNFLLGLYSDVDVFYEGKLWREKTNLRLGNDELAISNLKPLANNIPTKNKLYAEVNATLAQAFLNIKAKDSALKFIKRAASYEKTKNLQTRYRFIEAQIFEELNQKDSAQLAFNSIVDLKRKSPRLYWMHAKLNALRIKAELSSESPEKALQKLSDAFENQQFNHLIYRQQAQYNLAQGRDSLAKVFYNKSIKASSIDQSTLRQNYRDLADDAFFRGQYVETGAYLDSLLGQYPIETRQKTIVLREREGLEDVVNFEKIIRVTDSILTLTEMIPEEQLAYFKKAINAKRAKELAQIELKKKPLFNALNRSNGRQFYFYNQNLVILGKQQFASNFGNRPNKDNWNRIESLNQAFTLDQIESQNTIDQVVIVKDDAQAYINLLPKDPIYIDSLHAERNQAYLEVGVLYKEKFKNNALASDRLKKLLVNKPLETDELSAWYHLYKMDEADKSNRAKVYKEKILRKYPDSRFARIIRDPENFKLRPNETPSMRYETLYALFVEQKHEEVLTQGDNLLVVFSGTPMASKVAHLMANATGRLDGIEVWKERLTSLVKDYPNSEAALQANKTLLTLEANAQDNLVEKVYLDYKLIFPLLKDNKDQLTALTTAAIKSLEKANVSFKKITLEVYNRDYIFLVINGLKAETNIIFDLPKETEIELSAAISNKFVVLSSQYKDIQLIKSWNAAQK